MRSDQISRDLASLKADRTAPQSSGSGNWRRTATWATVIASAGTASYVFGVPYLQSRMLKPRVQTAEIILVSPVQSTVQLTSTGYVVPQRISKVGSRVAGRIAEIHTSEGDSIAAGDVIARLDDSDPQAELVVARARVLAAKARAESQRAELDDIVRQAKRERGLADRGVAPSSAAQDLESRVAIARAAVKVAQADVRVLEAEVQRIEAGLDGMTILAPMDGTVLSKPAELGELVGPLAGELAELADLKSLMLETAVPEGRLHLVQIGSPCEITLDAFPSDRRRGRVVSVSPRVDRAKATVTVKVRFLDSTHDVLPEMAARVSFLSEELDATALNDPPKVFVPAAAVVQREGTNIVYVVDEGRVRVVPIKTGPQTTSGLELVDGPPVGTTVVRDPPDDLQDGQQVREGPE